MLTGEVVFLDYLYDGTFDGFLTVVYHHYYTEKAEGIYLEKEYQCSIGRKAMRVDTDSMYADKVYMALERSFTAYDMRRIYRVFLSSYEDKDMVNLRYIWLGFKYGTDIGRLHGNDIVFHFQRADGLVTRDIDKYLGLIRFSYLENGMAFSRIDPDTDVLPLIADHFSDRFREEPFAIYDERRKKAVVAFGGSWNIAEEFDIEMLPPPSESELEYRRLWKEYFEHIAIRERTNPKCQRNCMPKKYWKHLTEMLP